MFASTPNEITFFTKINNDHGPKCTCVLAITIVFLFFWAILHTKLVEYKSETFRVVHLLGSSLGQHLHIIGRDA